MAIQLTQAQWYGKLKGFIPGHIWASETIQKAVLMAMSKALSEVQARVDEHIDDTFISRAADGVLDTHGRERSLTRLTGQIQELDPQFSRRVRSLVNQSNIDAIRDLVNTFLIAGVARVTDDFNAQVFLDREFFCNRGAIIIDPQIINTFSIIVDKQIHEPYSFSDREYFLTRENFVGGNESSQYIFDIIKKVIDDNKALGTLYRIIELLE